MFDAHYKRLMAMKKAEIIDEGIARGFWDARAKDCLMKTWKKVHCANFVTDRIVRMELRGY